MFVNFNQTKRIFTFSVQISSIFNGIIHLIFRIIYTGNFWPWIIPDIPVFRRIV